MILIVKPAFYLSCLIRIAGVVLVCGSLNACGQRGPLYLPGKPDAATPAPPAPVPTDSKTPISK